jgi:hypothetical protein
MLWYKSWLDTRWRFVVPLVIVVINVWGLLLEYPQAAGVLSSVNVTPDALTRSGALGRTILEEVTAQRTYRGYVWYQWFRNNLTDFGTLFAVLLGSGSLLSAPSGAGTLFTLSLPVSRQRWLVSRVTLGLCELLVLVVLPSLAIVAISPAIGQQYAAVDALVHAFCVFTVSAVFFSLAFLLSAAFPDIWRPFLIAGGTAIALSIGESQLDIYGLFRVMSGGSYFTDGSIPWIGLFISVLSSAALLYAALTIISTREF